MAIVRLNRTTSCFEPSTKHLQSYRFPVFIEIFGGAATQHRRCQSLSRTRYMFEQDQSSVLPRCVGWTVDGFVFVFCSQSFFFRDDLKFVCRIGGDRRPLWFWWAPAYRRMQAFRHRWIFTGNFFHFFQASRVCHFLPSASSIRISACSLEFSSWLGVLKHKLPPAC